MKPLRFILRAVLATTMAVTTATGALANDYPSKPVKIVVPFPPGGSIDMVARLVGQHLADEMKQPFVVDNRPGASGNIGMDYVAKSPKDGYTLLLSHAGLASNAHLFAKLPFDPVKDLAPIIRIADQPNVLIINPLKLPVSSVQELITYLRAHPGKASFGTSGVGGPQDVAARVFMRDTDTDMFNVAYKGGAPALSDLLGGQIDLMFETSPTAVPYVKSGKLKALGVTSDKRLVNLPDVPTIAESGVKNYNSVAWMGLVAPAGTPQTILVKLNAAMQKLLAANDLRKQLMEISLVPAGGSVQDFVTFVAKDSDYYARLVKESNITPQ